jgi:hypothetical protein
MLPLNAGTFVNPTLCKSIGKPLSSKENTGEVNLYSLFSNSSFPYLVKDNFAKSPLSGFTNHSFNQPAALEFFSQPLLQDAWSTSTKTSSPLFNFSAKDDNESSVIFSFIGLPSLSLPINSPIGEI